VEGENEREDVGDELCQTRGTSGLRRRANKIRRGEGKGLNRREKVEENGSARKKRVRAVEKRGEEGEDAHSEVKILLKSTCRGEPRREVGSGGGDLERGE
jgi:hypothetical protein